MSMIGYDRWRAPACADDAYRLADSRELEMKAFDHPRCELYDLFCWQAPRAGVVS
jgi:hypothetical protein